MCHRLRLGATLGLALASTTLARQPAVPNTTPISTPGQAEMFNFGLRGVYFVENQGQWSDASVHYGFKTRGLDIAFRESSFTMHLARPTIGANESTEASPKRERGLPASQDAGSPPDDLTPLVSGHAASTSDSEDAVPMWDGLTLTVTFPGSNEVQPQAANAQSAKFNYFIGDDESKWASNVPSFGEVVYPNLYDGVDLYIKGDAGGDTPSGNVLKYEFHVAPGADYSQIQIRYDGIDSLCVDPTGELQIATSFGILADAAPVVWQEDGGTAVPAVRALVDASPQINGRDARSTNSTITARFELIDDHTYCIVLDGPVDAAREIIIDPDVAWMRYLGGNGTDEAYGVAVDADGRTVVSGMTRSTDFAGRINDPYSPPTDLDAFAASVDSSGSLEWMTYLGGDLADWARRLVLGSSGETFITGHTFSRDFAGRRNEHHGPYQDIDGFLLRLSRTGHVEWMLYLGGTNLDTPYGITRGSDGDLRISGHTWSFNFEGRSNSFHGGLRDAFVASVSDTGVLNWMMYLGGTGNDNGVGIACDASGNTFVTGTTTSTDFAGRTNSYHGSIDSFVAKLDSTGAIEWMSYFGGSRPDFSNGAQTDVDGNVIVSGSTESTDFEGMISPLHGGEDAMVLKVNRAGALQWVVPVGGAEEDTGRTIALDPNGHAILAGYTVSPDFEGATNFPRGGQDAFIARVSTTGDVLSATFIGGSGNDRGWDVALASSGSIYLAGTTGSSDFEGRLNSIDPSGGDAFVAKVTVAELPALVVSTSCPTGGPIQIAWTNATPNARAALLFARNTGSFTIPNHRPCSGTLLGLGDNQLQIIFTGNSDRNGSRTLNANAGPNACGAYLQLLDLSTCSTSNVARIE